MAKAAMTAEHKEALAQGRAQARAVKNYLEALATTKPKRGRRRTPESIEARLTAVRAELDEASALRAVQLVQERINLEAELEQMQSAIGPDLASLERAFVANVKAYSEAKGISYAAWREVGVEATVLREAGLSRAG